MTTVRQINTDAARRFLDARDSLLHYRDNLGMAQQTFRWPEFEHFNWAWDYYDVVAARNDGTALRLVDDGGNDCSFSFGQMAARSQQVAAFLADLGVRPGNRILLMLPNCVALWEVALAAIRGGFVIIPATTLLQSSELHDRIERGDVKAVITDSGFADRFDGIPGIPLRIAVGQRLPGWTDYSRSVEHAPMLTGPLTRADDLLLLYFTSGPTARPKLVAHTPTSYPAGHLSTIYWLGLGPGDVHLNLSSPGWAKHAWSSLFAPWNGEATIVAYHYERFDAKALLSKLVDCGVTTFCAPPTVWRMLVQQDLRTYTVRLRELASAGEPLNPEVIAQVRDAWGLTIRDGFGQTETTAQIGNPPGQVVKPGSMGRPLPGYRVILVDPNGQPAEEGEICIDLAERPLGLMQGYLDDGARNTTAMHHGYYHSGDIAFRAAEGYLTYVGRMDDVFKSSDYRISPFELESVLIELEVVVEAFVTLAAGVSPDEATAASIFEHVSSRVSPFKRIRRLQFTALPKTISGKIRRVELRKGEQARGSCVVREKGEYWEEDLPQARQGV